MILDQQVGQLLVGEGRLGGEAVERVQLGQPARHLHRGQRQARQLLADRDAVLVQAGLGVAFDGFEVAALCHVGAAHLVEQVGQQDAVVGVRIAQRDELLVLGESAVEVPVQDAALRSALDLNRLIQ